MQDKKIIIITGAKGFLGSKLLHILHSTYKVYALVRVLPKKLIPEVEYCSIDLSSEWEAGKLPQFVDSIIHLAQSDQFREFPEKVIDVFKVNIESTARLLDYAQKVGAGQFIYASSGGVYEKSSCVLDENSSIAIAIADKLNYYLGSKLCGEILVNSYSTLMQVVILRPFFMYGTGQNRSMLIPRLVDNIRNRKKIVLQGDKGIQINPIHIDDATRAVEAVLGTTSSATYNISGSDVLSIREICKIIGEAINVDPVFEFTDDQSDNLIGGNNSMIKNLHIPRVKFSDGIKDVL